MEKRPSGAITVIAQSRVTIPGKVPHSNDQYKTRLKSNEPGICTESL